MPNPIFSKIFTVQDPQSSLPVQTLTIEYIPYSESFIAKLYLKYWDQYGIDRSVLDRFDVRQVSYLSYTSNSGSRCLLNMLQKIRL
ncbi:hypothetical protein ACRRVA_03535 [Candidatus Cardinium hertigii]|uniref:hypothetical protein n=1 Tax=Candidatus Cardinium hertigii TaxID=247481 RepID=UPI003D7E80EE